MITTIIFDIGMVLVNFIKFEYLKGFGFSDEVYDAVLNATFESTTWNEYDRGELSDEELLQQFISNNSKYEIEIRQIFNKITDAIYEYDYSADLLKGLKERGYYIYLLSNYPKSNFEYAKKTMNFFEHTDGSVISYEIKKIKPEPEIYNFLIEKYNLIPSECVFLDDSKNNIEMAKKLGFNVIHFTDKEKALEELENLLIII